MIYQIACTAGRREGSVAGEGLRRIFENQIIGILSVSTAVQYVTMHGEILCWTYDW